MAEGNDQERTEPATAKKRSDARNKGQVAKSREVPSVLVLISGLTVFYFAGGWMFNELNLITGTIFRQMGHWTLTIESAHAMAWQLFLRVILILAPLLLMVILGGLVGNVSQVGLMVANEALTPKFDKLNPLTGFKGLFSSRSVAELVKSIFKVLIIGGMAYSILKGEVDQIPALVEASPTDTLTFIGRVSLKMGYYTCLVLIILATADYLYQRWKYENDLKMTKQEVKDEHKQQQGDPMVKSRIRSAQREMAMRRMMEAVPKATVVITNPTHLAIAIKFDRDMPAPMVVAKGAGHVAQRIRALAAENDIPIIEQKPLARAMFKTVEIGQYIPVELYKAVAEVLAYVYRLKGLIHA